MKNKEINSRQTEAMDGMDYSIRRIDILVISISGAGIYICLESMKYFVEEGQVVGWQLKIAGVMYLLGIVLNIISQVFGYKTHSSDFLMLEHLRIAEDRLKKKEQLAIEKYEKRSDVFSYATRAFTYLSILALFVGLFLQMNWFWTRF